MSVELARARLVAAAIFGMTAVVLGAFAAHGLRGRVSPEALESFRVGTSYHLLHSVVLLALALQGGAGSRLAFLLFAAGIVLFSGSIYGLTLAEARWLGPVTPLGGLLLIGGWLALIVRGLRRRA